MDAASLSNLFSGSWTSSYTYQIGFHQPEINTSSTVQMHSRQLSSDEILGLNMPYRVREAIEIDGYGIDEAGPFNLSGRVWEVRPGSSKYLFQFQKSYPSWSWTQWGFLVGTTLQGFWGTTRGEIQGYAKYERLVQSRESIERTAGKEAD